MVNPLVARATSDMLIGPDWALNIEICDVLNRDPGQTKDVVKGLKKRIGSRNPKSQLLALTLLETIIKNCGDIVHMHVAERDILHEMVKIVKKKPDSNVKEKILILIDTWQEAFGGPRARYPQYYAAYQELLRAGAVFPQRSEQSAPVFTPLQSHPLASYPQNIRDSDARQGIAESSAESEFPTLSLTEIQNARGIMDVLAEMLNAIDPDNKEGLSQEVIVDLVEQCRTYKQRVVHLVNSTTDESLLCQGLSLNDDLQRLLAKHESISSGSSAQNNTEKPKAELAGALVDVDGPLVDTGDTSNQTIGSSSSAEAGSQTLNQLLLPAPPTSNSSPLPAKINPKLDLLSGDLLSGDDYNSPKTETSLALVPVGEQQAASPMSQQNALVLFDMFSDGSNPSTSVNTQPTNVAGQTSPFGPQFQQQQTFTSQGGFYPNGNVPNGGSPRYEQSPYTQGTDPAWNGQAAQQQQPSSPAFGSPSVGSMPPPPWEAQPTDGGSPLAGTQYPQSPQATQYPQSPQATQYPQSPQATQYPQPPHGTQYPQPPQATQMVPGAAYPQGPQAMGNDHSVGMYMQPNANNQMVAVNNHAGQNNQMGLQPQYMQGVAGPYMGMVPHQMQNGPVAAMYPQQMYGNQFMGYGYGQQQGVQYVEQQMYGLSMRDDNVLRNSYQVSTASNVPSGKPSKPEDNLFGDLVSMAKVKPKSPPGRAGSM